MNAAMMLGRFGADAVGAVPQLIDALDDKNQAVVGQAVVALGMIGPKAKDAVPHLERLATSRDKGIAAMTRAALKQIQKSARK